MPSLETEYFLRLARVGSVVLALSVAGFFVLRTQRQTTPPPPVDVGIPVILLENASVSENAEAIEFAPDAITSTHPFGNETRSVLGNEPLVAPTTRVDLPRQNLELPPVPAFPTEPLRLPGNPVAGATDG